MNEQFCLPAACPVVLSSTCVFYEGENLIYAGINTGDSVEVALQKLDARIKDVEFGYYFENGIIQHGPGHQVELGGTLFHDTTIAGAYNFTFTQAAFTAHSIAKVGGTSNQFLKADGSVDSTNYQPSGSYLTALTGDISANGPGSATATLITVNSNPGTYGSSTSVPQITVDAKGRVTAITPITVYIPSGSLSFVGDVTGIGSTGTQTTLTLATVTDNVYTSNTFLKFSVNGKGLVTDAQVVGGNDINTALGYTPANNNTTITINGVTYNLSGNRSWSVGTLTGLSVFASTGIDVDLLYPNTTPILTITNTAPDRIVSLVAGAGMNVTGTYPSFNVASTITQYTDVLARQSISGGTGISYDNITGIINSTITQYTDTLARLAISLTTIGSFGSATYSSSTGVFNIPTYTLAGLGGITASFLSATSPLSYNSSTGVFSIQAANTSQNGYLSSTDWNIFNNKQAALGFTPVPNTRNLTINGTTYDLTADRSWSVGTVTSVGLSMPAAFIVSSSPVTSSGVISVVGAGVTTQYIRGDGSLANFPSLSGYVPYTGATSDVDLGTHKLSLNSEQFASISAPTYSEGLIWYDTAQKSLAFYNDSALSPIYIGENIVLKVYNNTGSTISKGAAVYIQSGGSYTYPNVGLAKADSASTAAVIGLMNADTPTGSFGYVTSTGIITGVNTGSMTEGTVLYLSPYSAGQLMNTIPPTGYVIQVGVVAHNNTPNGTIYTKQTTPLAISALTITGTLAINQGGTGATTAAGALSNLGGIGLTSLSASSPLSYNNTTGAFSISQATTSTNGYLNSTDWNTFNNKQPAGTYVNSITATGPLASSGGVNPNITISQANSTTNGYLSSTDWNTFNSKQNALTNPVTGTATSGQVSYFNGTSSIAGSNNHFWDATNNRLGLGTINPQRTLTIYNATADNHLQIAGSAPSVSLSEAITGALYQAKFGLATSANQYATGTVAGDFIIISQTASIIWVTNSIATMKLSASGQLSIGTLSPNASAVLQADSTTQGFLPPRMTAAQRVAISSPATGLIVYQTDGTEGLYIKISTGWKTLVMA